MPVGVESGPGLDQRGITRGTEDQRAEGDGNNGRKYMPGEKVDTSVFMPTNPKSGVETWRAEREKLVTQARENIKQFPSSSDIPKNIEGGKEIDARVAAGEKYTRYDTGAPKEVAINTQPQKKVGRLGRLWNKIIGRR